MKRQASWPWFDQRRDEDVVSAEAYALLSQLRPVVLRQRLNLRFDRLALQNAQRTHELASELADDFRTFLKSVEREQRRKHPPCRRRDPARVSGPPPGLIPDDAAKNTVVLPPSTRSSQRKNPKCFSAFFAVSAVKQPVF